MPAALPKDEDFRVAHYLARAEERGECLCIGTGRYYPTWLRPDIKRSERIAQLVCRYRHGKRPHQSFVVMHHCDNKACIRPEHLCWGTQKQNIDDALRKGRMKKPPTLDMREVVRAGRHHAAKLTPRDIPIIRKRLAAGEKQFVIAADFGVGDRAISKIKTGERWGWC